MTATITLGLVEDNDDDAANFARAFAEVATVRRWPSGEALLQELELQPSLVAELDLLVLDLNLPGADGVATVAQLREQSAARPPIVILTGSHAEHDILRALAVEVDEYEVKPHDLAGLRALVGRCTAIAGDAQSRRPQPGAG